MQPTVYVVTPVHNRRHFTEPFLGCMAQQTWSNLKVIIVDDGSTDGTGEMIRTKFPDTIVIDGDGNLHWTKATNLGIQYAIKRCNDYDYILIMNDDLEVDNCFITKIVNKAKAVKNSIIGAVTTDINDPEQLVHDGGVIINKWTAKHKVLNRGKKIKDFTPDYFTIPSYLTGRATLFPSKVFREIGVYNESFTGCADTELTLKAKQNGYRLIISYGAIVKSYVDAVSEINSKKKYRILDIKEYYFGVKSYARLKYRFHYARAATSGNPLRFLSYFLFDLVRITYHFLRRVRPAS